jgi:hypothetical protein
MNQTTLQVIKWLGFVLYVLAFVDFQKWIDVPVLEEANHLDIYVMIASAVLAFIFGNPMKWLGIAIFAFGIALHFQVISLNIQNLSLSAIWVMLSGYLMLFFNSK